MFNCNGVFPITKCSGSDLKFNLRENQKQYRLSSSHNLENKVSLTVINNGKDFAENQHNTNNAPHCVTNIGGPGDNLSNMFRFNNKMYENNSGLDKKHSSYSRYLARKKGWNLLNQNCTIDQSHVCLANRNRIINDGNVFYFNKIRDSSVTFMLSKGKYLIKDVPSFRGFLIVNPDDASMIKLTPVDDTLFNLSSSILSSYEINKTGSPFPEGTKVYYGDIIIEVLGDFGKASIYEYTGGYKTNGVDLFMFDSAGRCV